MFAAAERSHQVDLLLHRYRRKVDYMKKLTVVVRWSNLMFSNKRARVFLESVTSLCLEHQVCDGFYTIKRHSLLLLFCNRVRSVVRDKTEFHLNMSLKRLQLSNERYCRAISFYRMRLLKKVVNCFSIYLQRLRSEIEAIQEALVQEASDERRELDIHRTAIEELDTKERSLLLVFDSASFTSEIKKKAVIGSSSIIQKRGVW